MGTLISRWKARPFATRSEDYVETGRPARRFPASSLRLARRLMLRAELRLCEWTARYGLVLTRVSLGIIFFWFGALKLLPATSSIDALAQSTMAEISFHLVPPLVCLHILAVWECLIGLGLIFGKYLRASLLLLFLHLPGTFLPLILAPHASWVHFPYDPTLVGHYIIKNLVLISSGIVIAAGSRGGYIVAQPEPVNAS